MFKKLLILGIIFSGCDYKESESIEKMGILAHLTTNKTETIATVSLFKGAYGIKLKGEDRISLRVDDIEIPMINVTEQVIFPNYIYNFKTDQNFSGKTAYVTFHRSDNRKYESYVKFPSSKVLAPVSESTVQKSEKVFYQREGLDSSRTDLIKFSLFCDQTPKITKDSYIERSSHFNLEDIFPGKIKSGCKVQMVYSEMSLDEFIHPELNSGKSSQVKGFFKQTIKITIR